MIRKYFGTDGIRGRVNGDMMTAETALRLGMAAGRFFRRGEHRHRVVIGKDTRLSGYMVEPALVAGFTSMGMDVFLFGPIPTPAVAFLTRSLRADIGVMISASHNAFEDNGIKLFGPDGFKLSDDIEFEIEQLMDDVGGTSLVPAAELGRAKRIDDSQARYIEFAKRTFPRDLRLDGIKLVLDCANGAAYKVAPTALWELGAEVVPIGVSPDGFNINKGCGSTDTGLLAETVRRERADIGIALDGDADRLIICDENGQMVDGDQIMGLVAGDWQRRGLLSAPGIVATIMSNLGLERHLQGQGLSLARTKVGDRYVMSELLARNWRFGGESSGHIICLDETTTGDGIVSALQVLSVMQDQGRSLHELKQGMRKYPQTMINVRVEKKEALGTNPRIQAAVNDAEATLAGRGRVLLRPSGTEPV
ncbi:MAG: phosphoglucosamine mutase, partial [Alphaproteobacteria bacterium]|nr:phosphoglucosamine mutase [Alphaproteobacteria bacterium]